MSDPTEALVARFRAGDTLAGDELSGLHRPALLRFARRYLRHEADAEDAVQEVFARVLSSGTEPDDFRVWAYTIARNVCLNRLRAYGADPVLRLATGVDLAADHTGELTRMARAEDAEALESVLAKLSDAQREVLVLRYLEDLGREEIAEVLGLTVAVVKSRLFEGVQRLRGLYGADGG